jgi:hypothetical protein
VGRSGVILYAAKASMNEVEGGALLYLTNKEDHEDACLWLSDNGFAYRRSQNIVPAVNQGYDTIPFIEIRCPKAAVLAKVRWV